MTAMSETPDISRRSILTALGLTGAAAATGAVVGTPDAHAHPRRPHGRTPGVDPVAIPAVSGVHLQFGQDPTREMTVSWHARQRVDDPRVLVAREGHAHEATTRATLTSYTDDTSGQEVFAFHARLRDLRPDTEYAYAAVTVGKLYDPPAGVTLKYPVWTNDNLGSPFAGDTTAGVERVAPLLHLFNGDLCYANLAEDRVRTWQDFWDNNTRSARNRPWMPTAGNHENELGNGPIGFRAYQTYFDLPRVGGQTAETEGLWYAYTVGSERFVHLQNDDVCLQDGGSSYIHGYSHGAQKHPVRGHRNNRTQTPIPHGTSSVELIDAEQGAVHMIIGGGGTSAPSNQLLFDPPQCRVIVAVGDPDPSTGKRPPVYVYEPDAPWSASRDKAQAYGFAAFEVDPGHRRGGYTTMTVTYYEVVGTYGKIRPFETFRLRRTRSDG